MYYAAMAQWVMLCKEPVCGPGGVCGTTLRRVEDSAGCLNPRVSNLFKQERVLDWEACPLPHLPVVSLSNRAATRDDADEIKPLLFNI